jgi:neurotransmitter:Na+ symporter, NSS family
LSLNAWSHITVFGKGFLDLFDYLTANVLLPLGGVAIAIFAGWIMRRASSEDELGLAGDGLWYRVWLVLVQFVAPACVVLVFLNAIGLF